MLPVRPIAIAAAAAILTFGSSIQPPASDAAAVSTTLAQRAAAAKAAAAKRGAPYQLGATGPRRFDCSGLVDFAYRVAKHPLGVRTSQQMAKLGAGIRRTAIKPGDLVFTWSRTFGHVGIAIGGGKYVHAPAPGRRVTIAPIPSGSGLIAVRRP